MSKAITDVVAERARQVAEEGWTPEHDDISPRHQLAGAATAYASHVYAMAWIFPTSPENYRSEDPPYFWPWSEESWKPKSPRQDLVRSAALIIAEIDRLDRIEK